jgi:Ca2+/Na+ antiporter
MKWNPFPNLLNKDQLQKSIMEGFSKFKTDKHGYKQSNLECIQATLNHFNLQIRRKLIQFLIPLMIITILNIYVLQFNVWILVLMGLYLLLLYFYWQSREEEFKYLRSRLTRMMTHPEIESLKTEELQALFLGATAEELLSIKRTEHLKTWNSLLGTTVNNYGGNTRSEVFHRFLGIDWFLTKIFKIEENSEFSKEEKSYLLSPILKIEQSTLQHKVFQEQKKLENIILNPDKCSPEELNWAIEQIEKLFRGQ